MIFFSELMMIRISRIILRYFINPIDDNIDLGFRMMINDFIKALSMGGATLLLQLRYMLLNIYSFLFLIGVISVCIMKWRHHVLIWLSDTLSWFFLWNIWFGV